MQQHDLGRRRTALVTGASYGIGAAVAVALARDDFDVAVSATRIENLAEVLPELRAAGGRVLPVALDLRSLASIERATDAVLDAFGSVDLLVNNAGVQLRKPATSVTPEEWDTVMQTNVTGTFFLCQKIGRDLIEKRRPGCIINMASTLGIIGFAGVSAYGISKAAIIQMSKMLAVEWAEFGIRVNAVAPGAVETRTRIASLSDPKRRELKLSQVPLRRFGAAEEVAGAVRYLASPQAAYITGHTLLLDGGLTIS
jgi:NAD(P)-dependent dehydrogenase (short-subunit alcohol dehydrogenase family)